MDGFLTPQRASEELNKSTETLRRWRRDNIGPPYVMHGGKPRYRSDLIHPGTYPVEGLQQTFPERVDQAEAQLDGLPPMDVVFQLIADWKEHDRWRRASAIITRQAFRMFGEMRFRDELAQWGPQPKQFASDDESVAFIERMDLEIKSVILKIGLPWIEKFNERDEQYFTMLGAKNMVGDALRTMVADEKRWRESAEWGQYEPDMPMKPPVATR